MTESEFATILEPLLKAEELVLQAMRREPKNYELHDLQIAIWRAMDKAIEATGE